METTATATKPYSLIAEQSVLSAMLQSKDAAGRAVQTGIRAEDFYVPANSEIFAAITELFNVDAPVDVAALQAELEKRGTLEQIGGLEYLVELWNLVPTTANLNYHANIVLDKSTRRRIIKAAEEIAKAGYSSEDETGRILDLAEQKIFAILEGRDMREFTPLPEILPINYQKLEKLRSGEYASAGIPTGFPHLDKKLAGLHPANLILIAARPAMGKTSLALNIAHHVAHKERLPVAIFSLEMSKEELTNRVWSAESFIPISTFQSGEDLDTYWEMLPESMETHKGEPLYIDDSGDVTVTEMRAKCRRLKREKGLGLIIIDHMQLMQGSRRTDNRQQEVAEISRSLKLMAKDLNVPVVVLSQLNRNPEGRAQNRPALSDLRESGAIEQDADVVLMLYRESYYNKEAQDNLAECIIAKHRNGPTGTVELGWNPKFTRFETVDRQHEE